MQNVISGFFFRSFTATKTEAAMNNIPAAAKGSVTLYSINVRLQMDIKRKEKICHVNKQMQFCLRRKIA